MSTIRLDSTRIDRFVCFVHYNYVFALTVHPFCPNNSIFFPTGGATGGGGAACAPPPPPAPYADG